MVGPRRERGSFAFHRRLIKTRRSWRERTLRLVLSLTSLKNSFQPQQLLRSSSNCAWAWCHENASQLFD